MAEGLLLFASMLCFLFGGSGAQDNLTKTKTEGWTDENKSSLRVTQVVILLGVAFSIGAWVA